MDAFFSSTRHEDIQTLIKILLLFLIGGFFLEVAHAQTPPVAEDDDYSTDAETTITLENVLQNDTDADDDPLTVVPIVNGAGTNGGVFNLAADGTLTFEPDGDFNDLIGTNSEPASTLTDSLLAHWTFDRADFTGTTTLLDVTDNGSHGDLSSFATVTRPVGMIGQALNFDGIDDRVTITASSTLDLTATDEVSIFAWIKRVSEQGNAGVVFDNRSYILQTRNPGKFRVQHNEDNGDVYIADVDSPLASDGEWHHYGQVFNGDVTVVYVDGETVSTTPVIDGGTDGTDGGGLGSRGTNHNGYMGNAATFGNSSFGGSIDDIRIYNRAINESEVGSLYQIGVTAQQETTSIDYVVTDGVENATGTITITLTDITFIEPEEEEEEPEENVRRGGGRRISLSEQSGEVNTPPSENNDRPSGELTPGADSRIQAAPRFTRSLYLGMRGEDVRRLQQFLNQQGFIIKETAGGSPGNETDYFGLATYAALVRYQNAFASEILFPGGLTVGSGYFGPATMQHINNVFISEVGLTQNHRLEIQDQIKILLERVEALQMQLENLR